MQTMVGALRDVGIGVYSFLFKKISGIAIYVTDGCNSQCKNCFQWTTKNPTNIDIGLIDKILKDKAARFAKFGLQGGEFFTHPEWKRILKCFLENRRQITDLVTNGLCPDAAIEACKNYGGAFENLVLSIDGVGDGYKKVRGVDGFGNQIKIIEAVRRHKNIRANFTICPSNSYQDYKEVKKVCDDYDIELGVSIYDGVGFFKSKKEAVSLDGYKNIFKSDYFVNYQKWLSGKVIPCLYIRQSLVVYPDGRVSLCQGRGIVIGDLNKQSLADIVDGQKRTDMIREMKKCNGCYMICQREKDFKILKYFPLAEYLS